jgi:hypothetical protein
MVFYYPTEVTADMGPTGLLPGSAYTTVDHEDRGQDAMLDTCEDHLASDATVAAKADSRRR